MVENCTPYRGKPTRKLDSALVKITEQTMSLHPPLFDVVETFSATFLVQRVEPIHRSTVDDEIENIAERADDAARVYVRGFVHIGKSMQWSLYVNHTREPISVSCLAREMLQLVDSLQK